MIGSVGVILAAASMQVLPTCSWDHPGHNPYMGDVPSAVERYRDIPPAARAKLRDKMQRRQYDDIATITRDGIESSVATYTALRDMHFGGNLLCRTVTTTKWTPSMQERGLVYCADSHCVIVPTVCRNVSRIDRIPRPPATPPVAPPDTPTTEGPPTPATGPAGPPGAAEATPLAPDSFEALQQPATGPAGPPETAPPPWQSGGPFTHYVLVPLPSVILVPTTPVTPPPIHTVEPPPIHTVEPPPAPPPPPIPEPGTLLMLLMGLGLIGAVQHWRRA